MLDRMQKPSMNRLLRQNKRTVMVAMDHARMNGIFRGIEDPKPIIEEVIDAGADAIMTSYGVIKHYGYLMHGRVSKILRMDTGPTRYRENWEEFTEWHQVFSVEDALRIGADAVISYSFPGIAVDCKTLCIIGNISREADRLNVPYIAEMHACPSKNIPNPYAPEVVASSCRIASEFGADMVKTDFTGDAESFKYVVNACPVPLIIAGGKKCDTARGTFEMIQQCLDAGGVGCIFGRQIWQDKYPGAMTRALVAIVHNNASVDEALAIYEEFSSK